jgi:integrase
MPKTFPVSTSKEEIDKILEAAMEDDFYYMLFYVAKSTGRRLGEYYNVKVKDFIPEKNILITQVLKRRKPVEKEAILSDEAVRLLKQYIAQHQMKLDDYIFRKIGYRGIQAAIKRYAKKAGIPHVVSFHNFRHFFITELVRQGWSYDKIAKLTGHSSVGTLAAYDHSVASDIKEDALEALKRM